MVKVSLPTGQPWFNCQWSQDSMVKVSLPTGQPSCLTVCPTVESRQNGQSDFPTGQPVLLSVESGQHGQGELLYRSAPV